MNTSSAIFKTPSQVISDIQKVDRTIVPEILITSPSDCIATINYLNEQKMKPGANVEKIEKLLGKMYNIIETKINLTAGILMVGDENKTFGNEQMEIPFEQNIEKETKVVEMTQPKTEPEVTKVEEKKEEKSVAVIGNTEFFKGYTRKKIYGTPSDLPKDVQILVVGADSESKIDEIAKKLIDSNRVEDALNLSIDLFQNAKKLTDNQEEIEKRFLFNILPWSIGTTCEPKDSMQNITLAMWVDQLKTKLAEKTVAIISPDSVTPQNKIEFNTNKATKGLTANGKGIEIHVAESPVIEDAVIVEETPITVEEVKKEVITQLEGGNAIGAVAKLFFNKIRKVVDTTVSRGEAGKMWTSLLDTFKTNVQKKAEEESVETVPQAEEIQNTTETVQETKEEELSEAEKDILRKDIEATAKQIIKDSLVNKTTNSQNEVHKLFKEKGAKKLFKGDLDKRYKAWRTEVVSANSELVENPTSTKKKILFKEFSVEEKNPDVWESAKLTKNVDEFKGLVKTIIFDKTKELPNGWVVAANLTDQYLNTFMKDLNKDQKQEWFADLVKVESEARKQSKQQQSVTETKVENKQEEIEVKRSEQQAPVQPKTEPVKQITVPEVSKIAATYQESIKAEKSKSKLNDTCGKFLMEKSYKTLPERKTELITMLKSNDRYSKVNDHEIKNYIENKIVRSNGAIAKLQ